MHRFIWLALFPLVLLLAAATDLAGRYTGDWKSSGGGGGGAFRMILTHGPDNSWKSDVSFDFQGEDVKTTVRTVTMDESKLVVTYDFQLEGNVLRTKLTGHWNGTAFEGSYETTSADGDQPVDDGIWKASPLR